MMMSSTNKTSEVQASKKKNTDGLFKSRLADTTAWDWYGHYESPSSSYESDLADSIIVESRDEAESEISGLQQSQGDVAYREPALGHGADIAVSCSGKLYNISEREEPPGETCETKATRDSNSETDVVDSKLPSKLTNSASRKESQSVSLADTDYADRTALREDGAIVRRDHGSTTSCVQVTSKNNAEARTGQEANRIVLFLTNLFQRDRPSDRESTSRDFPTVEHIMSLDENSTASSLDRIYHNSFLQEIPDKINLRATKVSNPDYALKLNQGEVTSQKEKKYKDSLYAGRKAKKGAPSQAEGLIRKVEATGIVQVVEGEAADEKIKKKILEDNEKTAQTEKKEKRDDKIASPPADKQAFAKRGGSTAQYTIRTKRARIQNNQEKKNEWRMNHSTREDRNKRYPLWNRHGAQSTSAISADNTPNGSCPRKFSTLQAYSKSTRIEHRGHSSSPSRSLRPRRCTLSPDVAAQSSQSRRRDTSTSRRREHIGRKLSPKKIVSKNSTKPRPLFLGTHIKPFFQRTSKCGDRVLSGDNRGQRSLKCGTSASFLGRWFAVKMPTRFQSNAPSGDTRRSTSTNRMSADHALDVRSHLRNVNTEHASSGNGRSASTRCNRRRSISPTRKLTRARLSQTEAVTRRRSPSPKRKLNSSAPRAPWSPSPRTQSKKALRSSAKSMATKSELWAKSRQEIRRSPSPRRRARQSVP